MGDIKRAKAKGSLRNITEIFFTIAVTSAVNSIVVNTLMNKVYSVKRYRLNKFIKDVYNYYCYNTKDKEIPEIKIYREYTTYVEIKRGGKTKITPYRNV
jgi:hypothetical protein